MLCLKTSLTCVQECRKRNSCHLSLICTTHSKNPVLGQWFLKLFFRRHSSLKNHSRATELLYFEDFCIFVTRCYKNITHGSHCTYDTLASTRRNVILKFKFILWKKCITKAHLEKKSLFQRLLLQRCTTGYCCPE